MWFQVNNNLLDIAAQSPTPMAPLSTTAIFILLYQDYEFELYSVDLYVYL